MSNRPVVTSLLPNHDIPASLPPLQRVLSRNRRPTSSRSAQTHNTSSKLTTLIDAAYSKQGNQLTSTNAEDLNSIIDPPPLHPLGVPLPPPLHTVSRRERAEVIQLLQSFEYFAEQVKRRRLATAAGDAVVNKSMPSAIAGIGTGSSELSRLVSVCAEEQAVYDLFLAELARQVSASSRERGMLLDALRSHYADMFATIPPLAASLHNSLVSLHSLAQCMQDEVSDLRKNLIDTEVERSALRHQVAELSRANTQQEEEMARLRVDCDRISGLASALREQWQRQKEAMLLRIATLERDREDLLVSRAAPPSATPTPTAGASDATDTAIDPSGTPADTTDAAQKGEAANTVDGDSLPIAPTEPTSAPAHVSAVRSRPLGLFASLPPHIDPEQRRHGSYAPGPALLSDTHYMHTHKGSSSHRTGAAVSGSPGRPRATHASQPHQPVPALDVSGASAWVHQQAMWALYTYLSLCVLREQAARRYAFITTHCAQLLPPADGAHRRLPTYPRAAEWLPADADVDGAVHAVEAGSIPSDAVQVYPRVWRTPQRSTALVHGYNLGKLMALVSLLEALDVAIDTHTPVCRTLLSASRDLASSASGLVDVERRASSRTTREVFAAGADALASVTVADDGRSPLHSPRPRGTTSGVLSPDGLPSPRATASSPTALFSADDLPDDILLSYQQGRLFDVAYTRAMHATGADAGTLTSPVATHPCADTYAMGMCGGQVHALRRATAPTDLHDTADAPLPVAEPLSSDAWAGAEVPDTWDALCAVPLSTLHPLLQRALPHLPQSFILACLADVQVAVAAYTTAQLTRTLNTSAWRVPGDCSGWYGYLNWLMPACLGDVDTLPMEQYVRVHAAYEHPDVPQREQFGYLASWLPLVHLLREHERRVAANSDTTPSYLARASAPRVANIGARGYRGVHKGFTILQASTPAGTPTAASPSATSGAAGNETVPVPRAASMAVDTSTADAPPEQSARSEAVSVAATGSSTPPLAPAPPNVEPETITASQDLSLSLSQHALTAEPILSRAPSVDNVNSDSSADDRVSAGDSPQSRNPAPWCDSASTLLRGPSLPTLVVDSLDPFVLAAHYAEAQAVHHAQTNADDAGTVTVPSPKPASSHSARDSEVRLDVSLPPAAAGARTTSASPATAPESLPPSLQAPSPSPSPFLDLHNALPSAPSSASTAQLPPALLSLLHARESEYRTIIRDLVGKCELLHKQKLRLGVRVSLLRAQLTDAKGARADSADTFADVAQSMGRSGATGTRESPFFLTGFGDSDGWVEQAEAAGESRADVSAAGLPSARYHTVSSQQVAASQEAEYAAISALHAQTQDTVGSLNGGEAVSQPYERAPKSQASTAPRAHLGATHTALLDNGSSDNSTAPTQLPSVLPEGAVPIAALQPITAVARTSSALPTRCLRSELCMHTGACVCAATSLTDPYNLTSACMQKLAGVAKSYTHNPDPADHTLRLHNMRTDPLVLDSELARALRALVSQNHTYQHFDPAKASGATSLLMSSVPLQSCAAVLGFIAHVADTFPAPGAAGDKQAAGGSSAGAEVSVAKHVIRLQRQRYGLDQVVYKKTMSLLLSTCAYRHVVREVLFFADCLTGTYTTAHFTLYTRMRHALRAVATRHGSFTALPAPLALQPADTQRVQSSLVSRDTHIEWASLSVAVSVLRDMFGDEHAQPIAKQVLVHARPTPTLAAAEAVVGPPALLTNVRECVCTCSQQHVCAACLWSVPVLVLTHAAIHALDRMQVKLRHFELAERLFRSQVAEGGVMGYRAFAVVMSLALPPYSNREVAALFVSLTRQNGSVDTISLHAFRVFICELCCSGVTFTPKAAPDTAMCDLTTSAVIPVIRQLVRVRPMLVALCSTLTLSTQAEDADAGLCIARLLAALDRELTSLQLVYFTLPAPRTRADDDATGDVATARGLLQESSPTTLMPPVHMRAGPGNLALSVSHGEVRMRVGDEFQVLCDSAGVNIPKDVAARVITIYKHMLDVVVAYLARYTDSKSAIPRNTLAAPISAAQRFTQQDSAMRSRATDAARNAHEDELVQRVFDQDGALPTCVRAELDLLEQLLEHRYVHVFAHATHTDGCLKVLRARKQPREAADAADAEAPSQHLNPAQGGAGADHAHGSSTREPVVSTSQSVSGLGYLMD